MLPYYVTPETIDRERFTILSIADDPEEDTCYLIIRMNSTGEEHCVIYWYEHDEFSVDLQVPSPNWTFRDGFLVTFLQGEASTQD